MTLGVPGTDISGSCGGLCPFLTAAAHRELKQVKVPDAWSCLSLPYVGHFQVLVYTKLLVGEQSFENSSRWRRVCAPLCNDASRYLLACAGQFVVRI